mmetsp:Transcript_25594/g.39294  ORF Transcript_25594/g.39294 Transcript_25594/m.39294 type:complete len:216 (+) Transcript_25594:242-889(+)
MLYWILRHTSNLWPAITLYSILVVCSSSLEHRFIRSSSSCDNPDLRPHVALHSFLSSRRKTKTSSSLIFIVGHNNRKSTRSTCKSSTITKFGFHVAYNGSFWDLVEREYVSDRERGLLSAVHKLTGVHSFRAQHEFVVALVAVGIQKLDLCNWCATTRIVNDILHNSANITMSFRIVKRSKLHRTLASSGMSLEDQTLTLSLCLDVFTHISIQAE